jgi:hypothetical protein
MGGVRATSDAPASARSAEEERRRRAMVWFPREVCPPCEMKINPSDDEVEEAKLSEYELSCNIGNPSSLYLGFG